MIMKVYLNNGRYGSERKVVDAELIKENISTVLVRIGSKFILRKKKRDLVSPY